MSENTEPQTDSAATDQAPSDQGQSTEPPQASSGTSPADSDHSGDSASPDSATIGGISDDQLPEDLQPGEDNPLAEPLDPDDEATKDRDELAMDATQEDLGKPPVESDRDSDGGEGAQGAGVAEG